MLFRSGPWREEQGQDVGFRSPRLCCGFDACGWPGADLSSPLVRRAETCVRLQGHLQSGTAADTLAGCTGTPDIPTPGASGRGTAGPGEGVLGQEPRALAVGRGRTLRGRTGGVAVPLRLLRWAHPIASMMPCFSPLLFDNGDRKSTRLNSSH